MKTKFGLNVKWLAVIILAVFSAITVKADDHGLVKKYSQGGLTWYSDKFAWNDKWGIGASCIGKGDEVIMYFVQVRIPYACDVESGATCLAKLGNDEVIELKSFDYAEGVNEPTIGLTYCTPLYTVSEEQIEEIIQAGGIKKLRMVVLKYHVDHNQDYDLSADQIEYLNQSFGFLKKAISSKSSVYDGF